ncbi:MULTISPECIES: TRAP transporter large permease [Virgibacillus]|uniref:Neu5Ac permease n=2 Tax=Virgibacillus TaxID=84406 RepID=A0A024Q679_9BACI|nr:MULTISPECIES: TRAP transporter large permease [Virgibacillus]EQB38482.1 membrane protein [Virgibacillus sp. CM-4]MYL41188.1 TRAP transporter large permease subunit [Virgibacillus massiliensis]GGJ54931.1 membrane protein [Virgibacillus kapii]CDQ38008.1 Neu5Ac permease [Virgibacillus massiliensis]
MDVTVWTAIILFGLFFLLLFIGVPIAVSIAIASFVSILMLLPMAPSLLAVSQQIITGLDSTVLLALVFFMLAGSIMNNGGIADRLINLAKLIGGRMSGSLAHTNIIGNTLFGAISGSAIAAAATMGRIMHPQEKKAGYDPSYAAAVNIASAPTGLIIPPSGMPIIYSLLSGGTSIGALFIAGYLPGILMILLLMIVAYILAKKANYPVVKPVSGGESIKVMMQAIPSLLLIIIVIGGIAGGIFTATEGAAVAVLYAALLSLLYRQLKIADIPKILKETIIYSGIIMLLIGTSTAMSWVLAYAGIPQAITSSLLSITDNTIILLLIMLFILLVVGTFMDIAPALLIFTPIFFPVATQMGIDPVHFGMIMAIALAIGVTTPPIGTVLFIGSSVSGVKIEKIIPKLIIFYIPLIIALLLVAFIPEISLFLPRLFGLVD